MSKKNIFTLNEAKGIVNLSRGFYKTRYHDIFGKKSRIFFPIDIDVTKKTKAWRDLEKLLKTVGYTIHDYQKGLVVKDGDKNLYKVSKLRDKLSQKNKLYTVNRILENFRTDDIRQGRQYICLSRHPLDLASASYGREWSSCLNWKNGHYKECLTSIIGGMLSFVAYLTTDTASLSDQGKVLGRKWVYIAVDHFNGGEYLVPSTDSGYGIFPEVAEEALKKVVVELNEKYFIPKLKGETRYNFRVLKGIYDDDTPKAVPICMINLSRITPQKIKQDFISGVNYGKQSGTIYLGKINNKALSEAETFFKYFEDVQHKPKAFFSNLLFCLGKSNRKDLQEIFNSHINSILKTFKIGVKLSRLKNLETEILKDHDKLVNYLRYQTDRFEWVEGEVYLRKFLKNKDKRSHYREAQALKMLIQTKKT